MLKALRDRLSYANVMATLAVFIAIGGSSYAAMRVTGRDVVNRSLTGADIKPNSLRSRQIKERSLGVVPRARNAARLGGLSARRFLLKCPQGTIPVSDVCVETLPRPPAPYSSAIQACRSTDLPARPGRRLPTHGELATALGDDRIALAPGGELTGHVYPSGSSPGQVDVLYIVDNVAHVAVASDTAAGARSFRCVADPVN